jgi:hypothetical protein
MFFVFNIFFFVLYLRMRAAKTRRARNVSAAFLIAGVTGLLALTAANPTMLIICIPIVAFYMILFNGRTKLAGKFFWSIIPFHFLILALAPHLFADGALPRMASRALIGLHFFNFFYSFPFMIISKMGWFHISAFEDVVGQFVSQQALFGFRYAPGMTLLACMGFTHIVMIIYRRYVPAPGEQWLEDIRFPLWVPLAGIPAGIVFYLPTRIAVFSWMSVVVWPVVMSLMAMQGIILFGMVVSRRDRNRVFIPIAIFFALLLRHAMCFFAVAGGIDLILGLGIAMRAAVHGSSAHSETDASSQYKPGKAAMAVFIILIFVSVIIAHSVLKAKGGSIGIPDMPDSGAARKYHKTSSEMERVTIAGPGGVYWIDKYEYPNKVGQLPLTGADIHDARDRCKARGGRLCTPLEWSASCMAGDAGYEYYLMKKRKGAQELIYEKCRAAHGGGVVPSGARVDCKNTYGIHDMLGNTWEMVEISGIPGMIGLMGQGAGSNYEVLNQCNWLTAIYENQVGELTEGNIGFRCCGDTPRTSNEGM